MVKDHVFKTIKLPGAANTDCLDNLILDFQERNLDDMEQQLIVAENLELVSPEKLTRWRQKLLKERQTLLKHKSKFYQY